MWVSTSEAADHYSTSQETIRRWCRGTGRVPPGFKGKQEGSGFFVWLEPEPERQDADPMTLIAHALSLLTDDLLTRVSRLEAEVTELKRKG